MIKRIFTPDNEGQYIRAYIGLKDITSDCFFAETSKYPLIPSKGKARIYLRDRSNRRYIDYEAYGEPDIANTWISGIIWWHPIRGYWKGFLMPLWDGIFRLRKGVAS